MNKSTLSLAATIAREYERNYLEYLDECEAGDKRYRVHYCEHGVDLWVDYDIACGACEMGYTMSDPMFRRTEAIREAKRRESDAKDLVMAAAKFVDAFPNPQTMRYVTGIDATDYWMRNSIAVNMILETGRINGFGYTSDILTDKREVDLVRAGK